MWRCGSERLAVNHIGAACSAIACVAAAADRRGPLLCGAVRLPVIHHGKSAHVCPVLGRHPDVAAWSHSAASGYAQRPPKQRQGMRHGALHPLRLARRASAVLLLSASISACSGAEPPVPLDRLDAVSPPASPAFPGAIGYGAGRKGGRGGRILFVTSLADNGPGTYRACVEASGPRICIFRVSGLIRFTGRPPVNPNPYLTKASPTPPRHRHP